MSDALPVTNRPILQSATPTNRDIIASWSQFVSTFHRSIFFHVLPRSIQGLYLSTCEDINTSSAANDQRTFVKFKNSGRGALFHSPQCNQRFDSIVRRKGSTRSAAADAAADDDGHGNKNNAWKTAAACQMPQSRKINER